MVDSHSMTGTRIWRAWPLFLPLAALILLSALSSPSAHAADPTPELVFQYPPDGAVLKEPVFFLQLCFAQPINKKDLFAGGDFAFSVKQPDGIGLGHRDVFQPDAYGVAIYPGLPVGASLTGDWKFHWRVTSPDAQSPLEGDVTYTVDPDGEPIPTATPPPCIGEAGTGTVTPTPVGNKPTDTPPPGSGATVAPTGSPTASPAVIDEGDDDPDIDKYAYITIGAAGVAAVIATLGYFFRRRIGFDPHKPTDSDDSQGGH